MATAQQAEAAALNGAIISEERLNGLDGWLIFSEAGGPLGLKVRSSFGVIDNGGGIQIANPSDGSAPSKDYRFLARVMLKATRDRLAKEGKIYRRRR